MERLFNEFEKLTRIASPSGHERALLEYIKKECEPYCDSVYFDKRGNLVCRKKNEGAKKLLLAAHADELGILAMYAEEEGNYRFSVFGGVNFPSLLYRRVNFTNGVVGVIVPDDGTSLSDLKLANLSVDIGAKSKKQAEKLLAPLTVGVSDSPAVKLGSRFVSRAIDDKVGCLILLELIRSVKSSKFDLYFCFTVEEELGLRGAKTVGFEIEPDIAIAIDVSSATDMIPIKRNGITLGSGAAIKVLDVGTVCDKELNAELISVAKKAKRRYQLDVADRGCTDAAALQFVKGGVKATVVSVATRYIHTPNEQADLNDVSDVIAVIKGYIEG
ncbi:MAG: M20/M25/M40 family metallo-hydrolase [Clostridia bacterium]|nr:M20/M25/M40 family metallo-hydrolase [Clostridia bacterium]